MPSGSNTLQVRRVGTDGTGEKLLTTGPFASYMPAFVPQNNGLLFIRDDGHTQTVMRLLPDGHEFTTGVSSSAGNGIYGPAMSPQVTALTWIGPNGLMVQPIASPAPPQLVAPEVTPYEGR